MKGGKGADFKITGLPWETEGETDFFSNLSALFKQLSKGRKHADFNNTALSWEQPIEKLIFKKNSSALFNLK